MHSTARLVILLVVCLVGCQGISRRHARAPAAAAVNPTALGSTQLNSPPDWNVFSRWNENDFIKLIEDGEGTSIVVDPGLSQLMFHTLTLDHVKPHSMRISVFNLNLELKPFNTYRVIFFLRPQKKSMEIACQIIKKMPLNHEIKIVLSPRSALIVHRLIEKHGIRNKIASIEEFPVKAIFLPPNVLNMNNPGMFRSLALYDDRIDLVTTLNTLNSIRALSGNFPNIRALGKNAKKVMTLLSKTDHALKMPPTQQFDSLYIIDRQADPVTPLRTPLLLEPLLDEFLGIVFNRFRYGGSNPKMFLMDEKESIYRFLRDFPFQNLVAKIQELVERRGQTYENTKKIRSMGASATNEQIKAARDAYNNAYFTPESQNEIVDIWKQLNDEVVQSGVAERMFYENTLLIKKSITPDLENFIDQQIGKPRAQLTKVLRLMCFESMVVGMSSAKFDRLSRKITEKFGVSQSASLLNLQLAGLLSRDQDPSDTYNQYIAYEQEMRVDPKKAATTKLPKIRVPSYPPIIRDYALSYDPKLSVVASNSSLYSVFLQTSPVLPMMILKSLQTPWKDAVSVFRGIPNAEMGQLNTSAKKIRILVTVLGGISYSELASLRILNSEERDRLEIYVLATNIVNGDAFIYPLISHTAPLPPSRS